MIQTLLKFRNPDSTLDLNNHVAQFFKRGIVAGGTVVSVPATLAVDVAPFKLIGIDGMVVLETTDTVRLNVFANQTNVIVFKSQYVPNGNPNFGFEVLELSVYNARSDIQFLTVFATITLGPSDTSVAPSQIDYSSRDVVDPVGRLIVRGVLTSSSLLPTQNNRPGDGYVITSGLGDTPGLFVWNGVSFLNITDALLIGSLLNAHRNNLFSNEIHLTDLQAAAVIGTFGTPSGSNKFVTSQDPRLPTPDQAAALAGLPSTPIPDASNPYVTAAFPLAQPTFKAFPANPGSSLVIGLGEGPVFVGTGGAGSAIQYFQVYHQSAQREFVNAAGVPILINNVFKDSALTQPLIPSSEPAVLADNGFYTGALYVTVSGTMDLASRLLYGQKESLANLSKGAMLIPQPAETTQEVLARLQAISGRLFDDPMLANETNVQLRSDVDGLKEYSVATTASDLVVDSNEFARLRQIASLAPLFPLVTGETSLHPGAISYSVGSLLSDFTTFDTYWSTHTPDLSIAAIINYTAPIANILSGSIQAGHLFVDGAGARYRILATKATGNGALMIYTGGATVSNTLNATSGQVLAANNPRQVEVLSDSQMELYREFIPIDGIVPDLNDFETLPPGGNSVGTGATFTLIGQPILPNQGSATGAPSGRPVYNILPKDQGNRLDKRVKLIGNWKQDAVNYPRQAVGQVSQGAVGIEVTGRMTSLTLYTAYSTTMPYSFRVFIDGVYNAATSLFLTTPQIGALTPSGAIRNLRGLEPALQPLPFVIQLPPVPSPLLGDATTSMDPSAIHTIRIEITIEGTDVFPLYGIELFYNAGYKEEAVRAFTQTELVSIDSSFANASPLLQTNKGQRATRFIDRVSKTKQTVFQSSLQIQDNAPPPIGSGDTTFTSASIAAGAIGDVCLYTTRLSAIDTGYSEAIKQTTQINKGTGLVTIESALGFATPARIEQLFRIPAKASDGSVYSGAPYSGDLDVEYLRLYPEDWDTGTSRDVSQLATDTQEDRVTVLDDGTTSLLVKGCQKVNTGLEGYPTGIRLNQTTSFFVTQAHCTRMDFLFSGNQGAVTVNIEIDGRYSYNVTLRGDGLERHTAFFYGNPQTHVVKVSNPSVANRCIVSGWIFHELTPAAFNGLQLGDYTIVRNSTASNPFYDFAPTSATNPLVTSFSGIRVIDPTKMGARMYDGGGGSYSWRIFQDFVRNPRHGYYMETDRPQARVDFVVTGDYVEVFYQARPDGAQANVFIDGVLAVRGANFPSLNLPSSSAFGGFDFNTGILDFYAASPVQRRMVLTGISGTGGFSRHTVTIQHRNTHNGSAVGAPNYQINLHTIAENPGTSMVNRRNIDDTKSNRLHYSSFRDMRRFTTLEPAQVGVATGSGDQNNTQTGIQALSQISSGLVGLDNAPYWFAVVNDFSFDAAGPTTPESPMYAQPGFTNPNCFIGSPKSMRLAFDATKIYNNTGTAVSLNAPVSWAASPSDLVGALFQPLGSTNQGLLARIVSATTLQNFVIDQSFSNTSLESCAVKQVIWTKDLVQYKPGSNANNLSAADQVPLPVPAEISAYVDKDLETVMVDAEASIVATAAGQDAVYGTTLIAYQANTQGLRTVGAFPDTAVVGGWTAVQFIPKYQTTVLPIIYPPKGADSERLFVRFFPAQTSGTGAINILRFSCAFMDDQISESVGLQPRFAWGYTDNSSPSVGCSIAVISGKTRITVTQPYDFGAFPGTIVSAMRVIIDGKEFPRQTVGVTITDGFFREIDPFNIELDSDYSIVQASVDIRFRDPQRSQLKIGQVTPLTWILSGYVAVDSKPFDGIRSPFETRTFTQLKLSAYNSGVPAAGNTTIQILKNNLAVATLTLTANGASATAFAGVSIPTNSTDKLSALLTVVGTQVQDITVELA